MYDENIFRERLVKLRLDKNVSQREMSLSLGQSETYIKQIENKSSFPSMTVFFNICDYFGIEPKDFFDNEAEHPAILCDILENLKRMNKEQLIHIAAITNDMVK